MTLIRKIWRIFLEILPAWIFFYLTFSLLRWTQSVSLAEFGVANDQPSLVFIASLVVAKSLMLMERLKLLRRLQGRPLFHIVSFKVLIYEAGVLVIFGLEQIFEFERKTRSWSAAERQWFALIGSYRFWVYQIWIVLLLFGFSAVQEMIRYLGKDRFMGIWFGAGSKEGGDSDRHGDEHGRIARLLDYAKRR